MQTATEPAHTKPIQRPRTSQQRRSTIISSSRTEVLLHMRPILSHTIAAVAPFDHAPPFSHISDTDFAVCTPAQLACINFGARPCAPVWSVFRAINGTASARGCRDDQHFQLHPRHPRPTYNQPVHHRTSAGEWPKWWGLQGVWYAQGNIAIVRLILSLVIRCLHIANVTHIHHRQSRHASWRTQRKLSMSNSVSVCHSAHVWAA